MAVVIVLGIVAGIASTVAGLGGGTLLVVGLSLFRGAHGALAVTAPALLLSNVHRAVAFRARIDRRIALAFAIGAVPGALCGASLLPAVPTLVLDCLLVATTLLALARAAKVLAWKPRAGAMAPAGFGIGALAATSGGGGMLVSPLFLSAGLTGDAYVGTVAAASISVHVGRIVGYVVAGVLGAELLPDVAVLAAALVAGNAIGMRLRRWIPERASARLELSVLVACTVLAVIGFAGVK